MFLGSIGILINEGLKNGSLYDHDSVNWNSSITEISSVHPHLYFLIFTAIHFKARF